MLELTCPSCGKRVQGDDSVAGKHVLCPHCRASFTVPAPAKGSPTTAIATPEHASQAKVAPASADSFRAGEPPVPSIAKDLPSLASRWLPLLLVVAILVLLVALLVPAVQKVRQAAARTQSTSNLKQIATAFHAFHDANKRLPYNGTVLAVAGDNTTGSWAFQILPYIDQNILFTTNPLSTSTSVPTYMCPGRGRPPVSTTGAWTDYFINAWVNHAHGGSVNVPDHKRTLATISNGASHTIIIGHGSIDPRLYSSADPIAQSTDIFKGGTPGTARRLTTNQIDTVNDREMNWGGPFPQGSLMVMADATVSRFPYHLTGGDIVAGVGRPSDSLAGFLGPIAIADGGD